MISTRSLRFRLAALITGAVLCCALLALAAAWRIQSTHRGDAKLVEEVRLRLQTAQRAFEHLFAAEQNLQQMLRLKDPDEIESALKNYQTSLEKVEATLGQVDARLAPRMKTLAAAGEVVTNAILLGDNVTAIESFMRQFGPELEKIVGELRDYSATVARASEAEIAARDAEIRRQFAWSGGALVAVLLVLSAAGWFVQRNITRSLAATSGSLEVAATSLVTQSAEVASGSQTVADGASKQAAALEEAGASSTELLSLSETANTHMGEAAREASTARDLCANSEADVTRLTSAMQELAQASRGVEKIIKSIDEIAFQTNLLALNAAVEAARAGEAGAGFAIVAEEVRALAQRSAQAARETSERIGEAIGATERGSKISQDVAAQLVTISARVRRVDELVAGLATSSREEIEGIRHIGSALTQIDQVTQANAAAAESSAAAASQMRQAVGGLHDAIHELRRLIGLQAVGVASPASPPPPPTDASPAPAKPAPHRARVTG